MKIAVVFLILGLSGFATAEDATAAPKALTSDARKGACAHAMARLTAAVSEHLSNRNPNKTPEVKHAERKCIHDGIADIVNLLSVELNLDAESFIKQNILGVNIGISISNILKGTSGNLSLELSFVDTMISVQSLHKAAKNKYPAFDECLGGAIKDLIKNLHIDINVVNLALGCESPSLVQQVGKLLDSVVGAAGEAVSNVANDLLEGINSIPLLG